MFVCALFLFSFQVKTMQGILKKSHSGRKHVRKQVTFNLDNLTPVNIENLSREKIKQELDQNLQSCRKMLKECDLLLKSIRKQAMKSSVKHKYFQVD